MVFFVVMVGFVVDIIVSIVVFLFIEFKFVVELVRLVYLEILKEYFVDLLEKDFLWYCCMVLFGMIVFVIIVVFNIIF